MRVRVATEKDTGPPAPPHPAVVGVLLAPVGGLVGTLAAAALLAALHGSGANFTSMPEAGVLVGSVVAPPVTALLFPIMFYARAERGALLAFGPPCGLMAPSVLQAPVFIVSGAVAGFVTALAFTKTMRHQPAAPAAKQHTD